MSLISNDLRFIFTYPLLLALPCIFHCFRHTFATTISLMNGVPLIALSKMLGHKSITTTQIYAKVTESMIDQAITTINDKIAGKYSF